MIQGLRFGRTPALTHTLTGCLSSLKIEFKKIVVEPEGWNTWSRVHLTQLSTLGCGDALMAEGDEDIKNGAGGFDDSSYGPLKLFAAHQT